MLILSVIASVARIAAVTAAADCVTSSRRRRSVRSERAPEESEGQPGDRAGEADEAEVERGELGDAVAHREQHDEIALPEHLHPRPDVRDEEPEPEQPEVAIAKRSDRGGAPRLDVRGEVGGGALELLDQLIPAIARLQRSPLTRPKLAPPALFRLLAGCESAWESNPPRNVQRPVSGFEDRGHHRMPRTLERVSEETRASHSR